MTGKGRGVGVVGLLLLAGVCGLFANAARETAADERGGYWVIAGTVGVACLAAIVWILWRRRSSDRG